DFNDFIAAYNVREKFNDKNQLVSIHLEIIPRTIGRDTDGQYLLSVNGVYNAGASNPNIPRSRELFQGSGTITVRRFNGTGQLLSTQFYDRNHDAVIFDSILKTFPFYSSSTTSNYQNGGNSSN